MAIHRILGCVFGLISALPIVFFAAGSARAADPSTGSETKSEDSTALETIVVTAMKREESLQSIAASISAVSGATIERERLRTYDDLQNGNLMRVVDRRKGLPVALGILYLHTARAQGWESVGLAFPGHFLVRLGEGAERLILDPFHGGQICEAAMLRELLKAMAGQEIELMPEHYAPVSDRDVLLRLQNNLKSRLLQAGRQEQAVRVVDTMLLLAPDLAELWHESGILHARIGNMLASVNALEEFVRRAPEGMERHQAAAFLQQLKSKLN